MQTHHKVPKCLGGGDNHTNLIALSPYDHFKAHKNLLLEDLERPWCSCTYTRHKNLYRRAKLCQALIGTIHSNKLFIPEMDFHDTLTMAYKVLHDTKVNILWRPRCLSFKMTCQWLSGRCRMTPQEKVNFLLKNSPPKEKVSLILVKGPYNWEYYKKHLCKMYKDHIHVRNYGTNDFRYLDLKMETLIDYKSYF